MLLLLSCSSASPRECSEIRWFGAASTQDALTALVEAWPGAEQTPVRFNFAGTNVLAGQLAAGARADLFLSANQAWMDAVKQAPGIKRETERPLVANQLVLAARPELAPGVNDLTLLSHADTQRLVIADPDAVPAGTYARAWLKELTLEGDNAWQAVANRVVTTADVRAALSLAEADPTILAVVYRSDAVAADVASIRHTVEDGPQIRYPVARLQTQCDAADTLLEFATSKRGRTVFMANGFTPVFP